MPAASNAPVWEVLATGQVDDVPAASEQVEVEVKDGKVYISLNKPAKVEVFTILGQLITQKKLEAGVSRLTLHQRGVYILKTGSFTRRINI